MKKLLTYLAFVCLTVFTASSGSAQTQSVVYNFGSNVDDPFGHTFAGIIAQGRDGNLYSSSPGGQFDYGVNFMLTPGGMLSNLYSFGNGTDGATSAGGLTLGTDGNFYGTTSGNGTGNAAPNGTIFRMTPTGRLQTIYSFTGLSDSSQPSAPPIQGADGNFYGTTCGYYCGLFFTTNGSIYKITPSGTFTVLHTCTTDCKWITAPLVQGTDGAFYGVSVAGGSNGWGAIFKITTQGNFSILYNFGQNVSGGANAPFGPLIQASDGNFYGTTTFGGYGINPCGIVFRVTPTGQLTVIHSMRCGVDGGVPYGGLIQATDGNLYGVNSRSAKCPGCGNVFKITPSGAFSIVYDFQSTGSKYWAPYATLFQHTNGLIYGMTNAGGTGHANPNCTTCGVAFSIDIGARPFVSFVSVAAKAGKTVQILGQGFSGTTSVSFNGVAASFSAVSDTFLTATVPAGATSGPVTVTTSTGTLKSNKPFHVIP